MQKEDIKIGLLGLIALTLLINTYFLATGGDSDPAPVAKPMNTTANNIDASSVPPPPQNPNSNNTISTQVNNNQTTEIKPNPTEPTGPTTTMKFDNYEHDYGNVKILTDNSHTFTFTNTGDVPLVIQDCKGTCGCTVPECPKEPIMPNKTGQIKVVFSPKETQLGNQEKQVIITANVPTKTVNLKIKANVEG